MLTTSSIALKKLLKYLIASIAFPFRFLSGKAEPVDL